MDELEKRFRAAAEACDDTVVWHARRGPAETMRLLAEAAEELGIDEWDRYGEKGAVERVEAEVAELLGKPAAVFFVSGTMAQQAALRVWCERRASQRVAIPDLAHQLSHETDGPRLLQGFRFETLTEGWKTATADDLRAIPVRQQLGPSSWSCRCARPAACCRAGTSSRRSPRRLASSGCRSMPTARGSGSRSRSSTTRLPEITALFDSVYVSFYKGLRAMAGAAVACDEDVAGELRAWRQRMGGTLFGMTPYALSALVGLRDGYR